MDPVKMRVNIAGFEGAAASLFCAYDPANDLLLIAREGAEFERHRRDGFLHITNQDRDEAIDALFTNDDLQEAISGYFEMSSLGLLTIASEAQRVNPSTKIERDGLDANGPRYRIAPDMSNGQVAVLVACRYAAQQRSVAAASEAVSEILSMITI